LWREAGRLGGDQHRARGGVLAEQGALRAAQQVDLGDVVEVAGNHPWSACIDPVDEHADRAVDAVGVKAVVAYAADAEIELLGVGQIDGKRRKLVLKVIEADHVLTGQFLGGQHGDRHGNLLHVLGALPRIDGHRLDLVGGGRRGHRRVGVGPRL